MSKNVSSFIITFWLALAVLLSPVLQAKPAQVADGEVTSVKAGRFFWNPDAAPSGAVVALVNIPKQQLYLYRHGILIGVSSVSTGKRGYGTPAGIFTVLEKDRFHRSRTYDNAPMPYANRLTWDGVALHAGHVTGTPVSHGCIRLPAQFARLLFSVSTKGMTVIVLGYESQAFRLSHPVMVLPTDSKDNAVLSMLDLSSTEAFRWQSENGQEGAISLVMNKASQLFLVYRNGIEIGRSKISLPAAETNWGTHAFIMQANQNTDTNPFFNHHWTAMNQHEDNTLFNAAFFEQMNIPADFSNALNGILTAGATLLITDNLKQHPQILREASAPPVRCVSGNCVDGLGIQVYADGSKYVGEFKNGVSEGEGEFISFNGEKYVGTFKNDKFQWDMDNNLHP